MKFISKIFLLLILFCFSQLQGQEVIPTYSDYLTDNLYLLHPSMAGASNMNKIRLTARQQWFDVQDAPALQTLSMHARFKEKIGLGGIVFNDQNGNYSKRGVYATFAYHLMFSRSNLDLNQLSFGLSGGFIQHSLDQSKFTGYDPLLEDENPSDLFGNVDFGVSYYYFNFFAHLTAKNVLAVNRELFYSNAVPSNLRTYLFSTGYVYSPQRSSWSYEPSLLLQWKEATGEKFVDLNAKVYKKFESLFLFGGLSYRRSLDGGSYHFGEEDEKKEYLQYLTPFAGMEYRNFLVAYTYSQQMNTIVLSNQGFHQITLGYNFGENRERYDCICPAVNRN